MGNPQPLQRCRRGGHRCSPSRMIAAPIEWSGWRGVGSSTILLVARATAHHDLIQTATSVAVAVSGVHAAARRARLAGTSVAVSGE